MEYYDMIAEKHKENRVEVKRLLDCVYLMNDNGQASGYVVIGEDKALVIDTMFDFHDISEVVRSVTDKPVIVVNTHGHCDHIFGNVYFEKAYIHPADRDSAVSALKALCDERGYKLPEFGDINAGDVIDLGGKTVEVIGLPGHTMGSILLLLREDRVLFTGDALNRHLWAQLDESLPLAECLEKIEGVMYLKDKADRILHGHARDFEPMSLMDDLAGGIREILDGKTGNDSVYKYFAGEALMHTAADGRTQIIYPMP